MSIEHTSYAPRRAFTQRLKKLGLTTSKAAKALGVSRHAVMHWKAGRRTIPPIVGVALDGIELRRNEWATIEWYMDFMGRR